MRPRPTRSKGRSSPPVDDEANRRRRQDPANRPACGLGTSRRATAPSATSTGSGSAARYTKRPKSTMGQDSETIARGDQAQSISPDPVGRGSLPRREQHEDETERDEEKADPVDLRLDDEEDPVERVERQPERQRPGKPELPAMQFSFGRFLGNFERVDHHVCNRRPAVNIAAAARMAAETEPHVSTARTDRSECRRAVALRPPTSMPAAAPPA